MNAASTGICSACGANAVVDGVCTRCGFASGEGHRCPHCGVVARVEARGTGDAMGWVCGVCGGPRLPDGLGGERAIAPLREVKSLRRQMLRGRAAFWVFALMATFATLVTLAAWPAALVAKMILLALAVTPTVLAVRARARAGSAEKRAEEAMDGAWLAAAEDVARRSKGGVTAAELGKRLHITPARADALLTKLAVTDRTRIDVGDDAEVRYSVAPDDLARVRVGDDEDPLVRAIEEAAAESESAQKRGAMKP